MSSEAASPALNLDNTYGVLFIACIFMMALWGAGTVQLYYYHNRFAKIDEWWKKLAVFTIWALVSAHQGCILKPLYINFAKNFANPVALTRLNSASTETVVLAAFANALVQALFVTRIWQLSKKNYILTGSVSGLVVAQFVATMVYFGKKRSFSEDTQISSGVGAEHAATALLMVTNMVVAAVLVFLVHSTRSGFRRTDTTISRLVVYIVNTGLITGLCGLAALITAFALPNTTVYVFFLFIVPELYMNCLLASLNSREYLRSSPERSNEYSMSSTANSRRGHPSQLSSGMHKPSRPPHIVDIRIETETVADDEGLKRMPSVSGSEEPASVRRGEGV
ncbi:hypothetical protein M0805_006078 [Coniferiporia weirii]|nr:hypothetical protein M0805_006078 [Coniferiporia weirii]